MGSIFPVIQKRIKKSCPFLILLLGGLGISGCGPTASHFNQMGAEKFGQRDYVGAAEKFKSAVFFDGGNPVFHNNLGYSLYLLKNYNGAEEEFRKALSESPEENLLRQIKINQVLVYCNGSADVSQAHKDWNGKGIGILQELLAKDGNNAEFHMRLGFAEFQAANPGGGFVELDRAVQLATPTEVAHFTKDATAGSLLILRQIQQFYARIKFYKKAMEVQDKITRIEKGAQVASQYISGNFVKSGK